jgi:tetratricopeptide (TPR) repeat protein
VDNLTRAIAADSNFAAAYAGLADLYLQEVGAVPGNEREMHARAERAARRAVALDDGLAESHSALAWAMIVGREWAAVEAELKRAVALDPRAFRGYEGLARTYMWTGRPAEQLAAARMGLEVNPFSVPATRELAMALAVNGRCDEALALLRPTKSLNPPARVAGVVGGQCHAAAGRWPEAMAEFRWAMEGDAKAALAFLAYAQARAGQRDSAQKILGDLLAGRKYSHGPFGIAIVYAGLGDLDQAFAWLDKAVDELTVRVYIMGPMFQELRRDPRFARFQRRIATPVPVLAAR